MYQVMFFAIGLVFIFEGLMPFLAPSLWRKAMQHMLAQPDRGLRVFGLVSMLLGLAILYWVRYTHSG